MGREVAITRVEHTAADLRRAAWLHPGPVACRLLAIAHVLDGLSRAEAARLCGVDRQTLCDWVHRYNAEGIEGLSSRKGSGRPARLSADGMAKLKALALAGPDPAKHGVVRWRCVDLQSVLREEFAVQVHERTVGKLLRKLELTRLQPRPHHPKKDGAAQEAFKKTSPPL